MVPRFLYCTANQNLFRDCNIAAATAELVAESSAGTACRAPTTATSKAPSESWPLQSQRQLHVCPPKKQKQAAATNSTA
jgi:hypothetical protein